MATNIPPLRHLIGGIILERQYKSFSRILTLPSFHRSPLVSCLFSSSSFLMSNNKTRTNGESGFSSAAASGTNPTTPKPTKTVRVLIKGRVQGVFYRNWTVENARGLGLKGWVRNKRDGSVEALFSGDPDSVSEMEQRCRRGPPDALVTSFQVFPSNDDPGQGFDRKPTS